MTSPVRVRYAPSPTGIPHVGNIRTALFNWLFARRHGGSFIVRIEDTDQARIVEGATEAILESLAWLGLDWDEGPELGGTGEKGNYGPYVQSKRLAHYQEAAERLVRQGNAYHCSCTPEQLDAMRKAQREQGKPTGYNRTCRNLTDDQRNAQQAQGQKGVIRFAMPLEGETSFEDGIRGPVVFQNALLDDFVILKSDGYPTYHLGHVVDDHLMEISHVLRADEWISSTPRHTLLYQTLGWQAPIYAHLPIILGPDRSKLSKRHGATSVLDYRDQGFLPEAMVNFLSLLGWSYDDHTELMSKEDLIRNFSLERMGKAGAIFNIEKLLWMNGVYIRERIPADQLTDRLVTVLEEDLPPGVPRPISREYVARILPLIRDRLKLLRSGEVAKQHQEGAAELTTFFFIEGLSYPKEDLVQKKMEQSATLQALESSLAALEKLEEFGADSLEAALRSLAEELGVKAGQLFGTLRVACTGRKVSPPLFETMDVLGRDRCIERIRFAIALLKG